MTLGTALLIIAILYIIDHHGLWRRAGQILLGLVILAVLVASGWLAYIIVWSIPFILVYLWETS
jgi:hypothetical protein